MIETTVYVVWDELGQVACHTDPGGAADLLEGQSDGRFRRVLALAVTLPPAGPIEMRVTVAEDGQRPAVRKA